MDRNKLTDAIRNHPNADDEMLREIEEMLEIETQKPENEKNYDTIEALSAAVCDASIPPEEQNAIIANGIERIMQQNKSSKKKIIHRKLFKPIAAVCACLLVLIGANAWSVHATDSTLWQLAYSFFSDHVEFQLPSQINGDHSSMVQSADDPYGIRAECEKDGFSPLVPKYIPDGFELTAAEHHSNGTIRSVGFTYKNGKQLISIDFEFHEKDDLAGLTVCIPSDQHNISELERNGVIITLSCEDGQYNAHFAQSQTIYCLFTENVDYSVSELILNSLFE